MRIAVVEPVGRGGMIHYAFQLARALAAGGDEVWLVTDRNFELAALPGRLRVLAALRLWDPKPPGEGEHGAPSGRARRILRAAIWYREWLRIACLLRRLRPEAVLLGDIRFPGDLLPLLLLRAFGLRLFDICHNVRPFRAGSGAFSAGGWSGRVYRRIYRQFEAVFVHYEVNRAAFLASFGLDPGRVAVIPHGNEAIFCELAAAAGPELPPGPLILLFGTLSRYKGVDVLIEAFAQVRRELPAARLAIAGFPAPDFDLAAHRALGQQLGVAEAIHWLPRYLETPEVAGWMKAAAVAAFPHREVFQSGVLQVAQTFGVAIVATRVGATPEMIEDGVSGLLVPPGDAGALARALLALLSDPALRRRLGARAAEDARSRSSWEVIARLIRERLS